MPRVVRNKLSQILSYGLFVGFFGNSSVYVTETVLLSGSIFVFKEFTGTLYPLRLRDVPFSCLSIFQMCFLASH